MASDFNARLNAVGFFLDVKKTVAHASDPVCAEGIAFVGKAYKLNEESRVIL